MINSIEFSNYSIFKSQVLTFSPGLNIITGDNGTGKTFLLDVIDGLLSYANGLGSFYCATLFQPRADYKIIISKGVNTVSLIDDAMACSAPVFEYPKYITDNKKELLFTGHDGICIFDNADNGLDYKSLRRVADNTVNNRLHKNNQIFLVTHSLFLLRELYMYDSAYQMKSRWFNFIDKGVIEQADSMDDFTKLSNLDEELKQCDRYLNHESNRSI